MNRKHGRDVVRYEKKFCRPEGNEDTDRQIVIQIKDISFN